ncbi:unnamed protein product [marine sediment metagenome]|uniref:Uncharacterized protein n=1 Tax=marine sediment metagenome TaxID=412755 RepID=X1AAG3_9ZZZZ
MSESYDIINLETYNNMNDKMKFFKSLAKNSKKIHGWNNLMEPHINNLIEPSYLDCLYASCPFPITEKNNFEISVDEDNIFNGVCSDEYKGEIITIMWKGCTSYLYDGELQLAFIDINSKINVTIGTQVLNYSSEELASHKPGCLKIFRNQSCS